LSSRSGLAVRPNLLLDAPILGRFLLQFKSIPQKAEPSAGPMDFPMFSLRSARRFSGGGRRTLATVAPRLAPQAGGEMERSACAFRAYGHRRVQDHQVIQRLGWPDSSQDNLFCLAAPGSLYGPTSCWMLPFCDDSLFSSRASPKKLNRQPGRWIFRCFLFDRPGVFPAVAEGPLPPLRPGWPRRLGVKWKDQRARFERTATAESKTIRSSNVCGVVW
jgi:hypothetical protein